jgi:hypothetical protein
LNLSPTVLVNRHLSEDLSFFHPLIFLHLGSDFSIRTSTRCRAESPACQRVWIWLFIEHLLSTQRSSRESFRNHKRESKSIGRRRIARTFRICSSADCTIGSLRKWRMNWWQWSMEIQWSECHFDPLRLYWSHFWL